MYICIYIYIYERCTSQGTGSALRCFGLTRRSPFGPDGMPCEVLWRPEALDCSVLYPSRVLHVLQKYSKKQTPRMKSRPRCDPSSTSNPKPQPRRGVFSFVSCLMLSACNDLGFDCLYSYRGKDWPHRLR